MTDTDAPSTTFGLDDEIQEAIGAAFGEMNALTAGYVDADGWAQLSKRGTVQVLDGQTIGMWARKPTDGMAKSIADRPQVTLHYVDLAKRGVLYTLFGTAKVTDDPELRARIFEGSPEMEQGMDAERKGVAIVVDLQRIVGLSRRPERNFDLQR